MFLYSQDDKAGASSRLISFRKNYDAIQAGKSAKDIDPELQDISTKLSSLLNIGKIASEPTPASSITSASSTIKSIENSPAKLAIEGSKRDKAEYSSAQKYVNQITTEAIKRESTVASVSNIGFNGSVLNEPILSARNRSTPEPTGENMKQNFES